MKHTCEECGIILKWAEVVCLEDENGVEHRVCIDCATDKYRVGESEELPVQQNYLL